MKLLSILIFSLSTIVLFEADTNLIDNTFTNSTNDNNWVNPLNWSLGLVPTKNNHAIIPKNQEIFIPSYYQAEAGEVTCLGDLTIRDYGGLYVEIPRPSAITNLPSTLSPDTTSRYGLGADTYVIDLDVWDISNERMNPVATTDSLQAAIDWAILEAGYTNVKLPSGHYLIGKYGNDIYQAGIVLHSNMGFFMDEDAILEMSPNDKWNYCAISVNRKENVVISGGIILGDRQQHIYTPRPSDGSIVHDEGHLICLNGTTNHVTITDVAMGRANGDGILIVGVRGDNPASVEDVHIINCNFFDNRRQGISIVGGRRINIKECEIHHTRGTSPQFGIDLEGAGRYVNDNVTIESNYFHHNHGGDIVNTDGRNVMIQNNILEQGEGSTYIDGPIVYWKHASQTIQNNDITMISHSVNNWNGIIAYAGTEPKRNDDITYVLNNQCNMCGFYMYNSEDLVIDGNVGLHLAFKNFSNLTITNNEMKAFWYCWEYRFLNVKGTASGNTKNGQPIDIPLNNTTGYSDCWL